MSFSLPAGSTVTLDTKWFPQIQVDLSGNTPPTTSSEVAAVAVALGIKLLQPKVTVKLAGATVTTWAPAGNPPIPNKWPATRVALLVVVGFVAFKLVRLVL